MERHPYPDLVEARTQAPPGSRSMCHICPYNGRRKVGCDGPLDAEFIGVGEGPGEKEETYGEAAGYKYGRCFVGGTGYLLKTQQLTAPGVNLVDVEVRTQSKWPDVKALRIWLINTIMCRPAVTKKNWMKTKDAKNAVLCCSNSLRAQLRQRLAENPRRLVATMGATALGAVLRRPDIAIEPYRGRPQVDLDWEELLAPVPEEVIEKKVLRGKKPKWEAYLVLYVLKRLLTAQVSGLRKAAKRLSPEQQAIEWFLKKWMTMQRNALRKRAKDEATEFPCCSGPLDPDDLEQ